MAGEPDGTLHRWEDLAGKHDWQVLLLGNGMSINVWEPFGYKELLPAARSFLTAKDSALFGSRTNFERVLSDLNTAIRVADIVGIDTSELYKRCRSIQLALGKAVQQVHLIRSAVPDHTLATIRKVMTEFEWVFTTSYDLLIYWAMGFGGTYRPFKDHFRYAGRCRLILPGRTSTWPTRRCPTCTVRFTGSSAAAARRGSCDRRPCRRSSISSGSRSTETPRLARCW